MITWLIEKDVYEDGTCDRLEATVKELGSETRWFRYPGFDGPLESKKLPLGFLGPVIVYGSLNAAKYINKKTQWIPGLWCNFDKLRCRNYLATWGQFSIHQHYALLPLSEVFRKKDWIYYTFGVNDLVFIRPDDNAKSFHGGLVHKNQFEKWVNDSQFYDPGHNCLTMVSTPSVIEAEWRLVIADKKVVAGSQYKLKGDLFIDGNCPSGVVEFAEKIAQTGEPPHPIYVMDICSVCWNGNGKLARDYHLLEIGSVNCAGLYGLDLKAVVQAANVVAEREFMELYGED